MRISPTTLLLLLLPLLSPRAAAQTESVSLTFAFKELQGVPAKIASGEFKEARAVLLRVLPQLDVPQVTEDPPSNQLRGNGYYLLGICQLELESYEEAIKAFQSYLGILPSHVNHFKAKLLTAESYSYLENWPKAIATATPLLKSQRITPGEREMTHRILSRAHRELENWAKALPSWNWLFQKGSDREIRNVAAGEMAVCLTRLGRFADLYRFVPYLLQSQARTNIQLNLQLLYEGDALLTRGKPDQALLLYRLVVPHEDLIADLNRREEQASAELDRLKQVRVRNETMRQRGRVLQQILVGATNSRDDLEDYPDYDPELRYRLADCYLQLSRYEEAIQLYLSLHTLFPESYLAEQGMYAAFLAAFESEDSLRAWSIAQTYMDTFPGGEFWEDVTLHSSNLLVQLEQWPDAEAVVDRAFVHAPDHLALDNMLYTKGYAQFMQSKIRDAIGSMSQVVTRTPESAFVTQAEYWVALGHLFLQEYEEARVGFAALANSNAIPALREDAAFRQGVAEYGLGDFPTATGTFEAFLETRPDSDLVSEAMAMIGDMRAANGELDEAILSYTRAMERATNQVQGDYAAFQMARTFELEKRWEEILDLFDAYLVRFGDEANVTQAAYWRGNALNQLDRADEARRLFLETILAHGDDPAAEGIDFIIRDLIEEIRNRVSSETDRLALRERVQRGLAEARDAGSRVLELRLMGLQIETTQNEELSASLAEALLDVDHLPYASPGVLALIGRLGREAKRPDIARASYEYFLETYPESDLMLEALQGLAENRIENERYTEAEELLKTITERFPTLPHAAEAYLQLGDVYRQLDRSDEAVEVYTLVLSVKEWRGPLWPTALLRLGDAFAERKQHREAFGYYQRVYVMYTGHPELAAEGYLKSAQALLALGETDQVKQTLAEMLDNPEMASQAAATEARVLMMSLP